MPTPTTATATMAGTIAIPAAAAPAAPAAAPVPAPAAVPVPVAVPVVPEAAPVSLPVVGGVVGCCGAGWAEADTAANWTIAASAAIEAKRVFLSMSYSSMKRTERPARCKNQCQEYQPAIGRVNTFLHEISVSIV